MDKFWQSLFNFSPFVGWLTGKLVKYGFNNIILPLIHSAVINGQYRLDLEEKQKIEKEIQQAIKDKTKEVYDSKIDLLFK